MNNHVSAPSITTDFQRVDSVSEGSVSKVGWRPEDGKRRQDQIKEARVQAYRDYQAQQVAQTPAEMRLLKIEACIADLQQKYEELKSSQS